MSDPKKKPAKKGKPAITPSVQPAPQASPNHAANQPKKRTISFERARQRLLTRYGYEEDELKNLFKTEDELVAFYLQVASSKTNAAVETEIGWDQTDAIDAPPAEKERFKASRLEKEKARYEAAGNKLPPKEHGTAKPTSGQPADAPAPIVSLDEFLSAKDGLDDLLAEGEALLKADEDKKNTET